jgi:hypothetical protein
VREELLLRTEAGAAGDSWSKCRLLRVPLVDGLEVLVASAAGCAQHRRYAVAASLPARMEPENSHILWVTQTQLFLTQKNNLFF